MSPSEILAKAIKDSSNNDYISAEVAELVLNWDDDIDKPARDDLLYVIAALVQSLWELDRDSKDTGEGSEYDMRSNQ